MDTILVVFLTLKISGGLGLSYAGRIDLSTLPDALRSQVRTTLSEDNLSQMARRPRPVFSADSVTYEIQLDESKRSYLIDETQANPDLLELIDELRPYLVLRPRE